MHMRIPFINSPLFKSKAKPSSRSRSWVFSAGLSISLILLGVESAYASSIKGYIDGIATSGSNKIVKGWACQTGHNASIKIHLYAGGGAGTGGTHFATAWANTQLSSGVSSACGTSGVPHRFSVTLSNSHRSIHGGKKLYIHGISPIGTTNKAINRSGVWTIPNPPAPSAPGTPSGPSSVYKNTNFSISWGAVSGATSYELYRNGSRIQTGSSRSKTENMGVGNYGYSVKACNSSGCSGLSGTRSVSVVEPPPPIPGTASQPVAPSSAYLSTNYSVSWSPVSGATSYELYRNGVRIQTGSSRSKTENQSSLGNYNYTVKACNSSGCGNLSPAKSVSVILRPLGTANLTAPASGAVLNNGVPCFTWNSAAEASHYTVQVSSDTNFNSSSKRWVKADLTSTNQCWNTSFVANPTAGTTPASLEAGQTYYWRIKSMDGLTSTGPRATFSNHRAFTVEVPTPAKPTGPSRVEIYQPFTVQWSSVSGTTRYELYRDGQLLNADAGLSESDNITTPGNHQYTVKACVNSTCSAPSTALSVELFKVGTAVALTPIEGATTSNTPCFTWEGAQDATLHTLQVGKDPTVSNSAEPRWVAAELVANNVCWNTSFAPNATAGTTPETLEAGETYYWRVKALASSSSSRQEQWTFTTPKAFTVEMPLPGVPDPLVGPSDVEQNQSFELRHPNLANVTYKLYANGIEIDADMPAVKSLINSTVGVTEYTIAACNVTGCQTLQSDPISINVKPESFVRGQIGWMSEANGVHFVHGWACQVYDNASINVQLWAGATSNETGGTLLLIDLADEPSEAAVAELCDNSGTAHRFKIAIPQADMVAHGGESIHMRGVSTRGTLNRILLNSGDYTIPSATPNVSVLLTYPGSTAGEQASSTENFVVSAEAESGQEAEIGQIEFSIDGVEWFEAVLTDGVYTHDFGLLEAGEYTLRMRVTTVSGSEEITTAQVTVLASTIQRRVIFIHTDLLGSPAAETDKDGDVL